MGNWHFNRLSRMVATQQVQQLSITESTTDVVATIDIDGFFISLNAAGYKLLKIDRDSDISRLRLAGFYVRSSAETFINSEIPNAIALGASLSEVMLESNGGRRIPSSQVLIAHRDTLGNIEYFSVVLRDISPIKAAEQERQALVEQLHQAKKVETIGRLAGGLAHDFNNYMTVIVGHAEISLLNATTDPETREQLEIILDTARKASRLSSQLLDISSKQLIDPQVLNLNEVLNQSHKLITSVMGEGVSVQMTLAENLWAIHVDRSQLEQIVLNLTLNSRDALSKRGHFQINTENVSLSLGEARASGVLEAGDYVKLIVTDDGCGVEEAFLNQIFDPFFTTKKKGEGTGLGLSAVYGAIKQNQSHIRAFSTVGVGTRFEIYFPRDCSNTGIVATEVKDMTVSAPTSGKERILLVEDDPAVRNLLLTILTDLGYEVFEATDGMKALEIYNQRSSDIDLVVSDVIMPNMNGMELFRELRNQGRFPRVLLMSGHTDQVLDHEELNSCNVKVLHKPFPMRQFTDAIKLELETRCVA